MFDTILIFLNLLRFDVTQYMVQSWRMFHVHLRRGCSLLQLDGMSLKISMRSTSSKVLFKTCVSLLIFCFDDLSIGVSGVLKTPTIIVLLSISPFMSVSIWWAAVYGVAHSLTWLKRLTVAAAVFVLCIEVLLCWVHRYLQLLCLPLGLSPLSLCSVLPYLL